MNELSFLELRQNRKDLLEAHKKNNFTNGIKALLTDLYPDTAHFIYELLQNAEDMFAKNVEFKLYYDRLEFIHDGTKRNFNLKDIDAITNIGHNSQKKNDPTSIGKFGVGFKAVFAYTSTPEIHSGNYHFRIKEYFLPDDNDVEILETKGKTIFIFPFNNPKKLPEQAFKEILKGLEEIDDNTLLFLKYIQNITYFLPNSEKGYVYGEEKDSYFYKIKYKHNNEEIEKESNWLRFIRNTEIIDEQNNLKNLNIGIAYSLEEKDDEYKIIPIQGKTYIYFPAVKENSNLFFHINAPFASTVARDSLRDIKENYNLIEKIGQLIYDSLDILKKKDLINNSLFKIYPNEEDNIPEMYQIILKYIKKAFTEKKLLKALNFEKYGYISCKEAVIGRNNFQNIFNEEILEKLFNKKMIWINNPLINQREHKFLNYLEIFNFNYNIFYNLILENKITNIVENFKKYSIENLKILYSILYDVYEENLKKNNYFNSYYYSKNQDNNKFLDVLNSLNIIKTTKGMVKAKNALFLPEGREVISSDNAFVIKELYDEKNINNSKVKSFLINLMKIREYSIEIEIEKKLEEIEDKEEEKLINSTEYFKDILNIAKYISKSDHPSSIDWKKYKFLLCETEGIISKNLIYNILVESEKIHNDLKEISKILSKNILIKKYKKVYSQEEYNIFKSFLKILDLEFKIEIVKNDAKNNPLYYKELHSYGRETGLGVNHDYNILKIEELLDLQSTEFNKMLWEFLHNYCYNYAKARYSPNASAEVKSCESTLLYHLKRKKWILGKDNQWYTPLEIDMDLLSDDYKNYILDENLLNNLDFGYNQRKKEKELQKEEEEQIVIEKLMEENKELIIINTKNFTSEQKEMFKQSLKAIDELPNKKEENDFNIEESFENLTKEDIYEKNYEEFNNSGIIKNVEKRKINIERAYKEKIAQETIPIYKRFVNISKSSNEEKEMLLNEYNGRCQICGTTITSYNNKKIFYATNIISTQGMAEEIKKTIDLGWNSLSLCPNCYTKYKNCSKDLSNFLDQVKNTNVIEYDNKKISIKIKLGGNIEYIRYTPRHFLTLKKVIELLMLKK